LLCRNHRSIQDKASDEQRAAAAAIAAALARAGGAALWAAGGAGWEDCCRACAAALGDASPVVRDTAALALAQLAACPKSPELGLAAALEQEKKPAKKQQLEKVAAGAFKAALVAPFVEAAMAGRRVSGGVAVEWGGLVALSLAGGLAKSIHRRHHGLHSAGSLCGAGLCLGVLRPGPLHQGRPRL
jgi:hypothetical protein